MKFETANERFQLLLVSTDEWFAHPQATIRADLSVICLVIKKVSVSCIHVVALCSFFKKDTYSSSANITKVCGLDGLGCYTLLSAGLLT